MDPVGYGTQMDAAAVHSTITVAAWTISKCLWHLFTMWCDGKALGIVKLSNKIGLEARRQLKLEPDARWRKAKAMARKAKIRTGKSSGSGNDGQSKSSPSA